MKILNNYVETNIVDTLQHHSISILDFHAKNNVFELWQPIGL